MADGAVNAFAKDGIERRADGQRQVVAIAEVAQRDAHQRIHRPAGQTVMEQRPDHRLPRRFQRLSPAFRRLHILRDRLRHREKHQVDADTGGEQHCRPAQQAKLRLGLLWSEFNRAKARTGHKQHKYDVKRRGQHVIPAERRRYPVHCRLNPCRGLLAVEYRHQ